MTQMTQWLTYWAGPLQRTASGSSSSSTSSTSSLAHAGDDPLTHNDARINPVTLLLSTRTLEQQFWRSVRVLQTLDAVGLFASASLNLMLIRKFGLGSERMAHHEWLWHYLPVLMYLVASLAQLALLLWRPARHQRHRFALTLANRLAKAATVTWAALCMSDADIVAQWTGRLHGSVPSQPQLGITAGGTYLRVLRTLASLPLLWVSHAVNFLLPFWLMLPLQLWTLLAASSIMPATACALLQQPPYVVAAASDLAGHLRALSALAISPVLQPPSRLHGNSATPEVAAEQRSRDLLLLVAFTFTMILVVIPCAIQYHVELLWKTDFLLHTKRHHQDHQQGGGQAWPLDRDASSSRRVESEGAVPRLLVACAMLDAVCGTAMLCEAVVGTLPPPACSGLPTWARE